MHKMSTLPAAVAASGLIIATGAAPPAQAATAYTVEPLNLNIVETTPTLFNGAVCVLHECVKVPTDATLDLAHVNGVIGEDGAIADGAYSLDELLLDDNGEKLVFGYSQGAQIAGFWLRNFAPTTSVDRATTSLLLVGDPENTYGVPWAPRVPTDTGFDVTEVWAQYDGWAEWPTRPDLLAYANAVYGMLFVHPTVYRDLDLAAEEANGNVVTWQVNDMTYKMVAEQDLPILDPLRNIGLGWLADVLNDDWRTHIEKQYDRPGTQAEADAMFGTPTEEHGDDVAAAAAGEPLAEMGADSGVDAEIPLDPEPEATAASELPEATDSENGTSNDRAPEDTQDDVDDTDDGFDGGRDDDYEPDEPTDDELGPDETAQDPQDTDAEQSEPTATSSPAEASDTSEAPDPSSGTDSE